MNLGRISENYLNNNDDDYRSCLGGGSNFVSILEPRVLHDPNYVN